MRILLVEDDETLASAVREQIAADGHAVDYARRLNDANDDVRAVAYDLILLDLMLPDGRGLDFLRQLRKAGDATPVIILTARDQISDRIAGLNAGADDYLVKPFDLFELSARVAAVSRRYSGNPNPLLNLGKLEIDLAGRSVRREGRPVTLTAREWAPVRGTHSASGLDPVKIATGRPSLHVRFRNREQHDRSPCKPPAQEARAGRDRNAARHRLPGENMMDRTASLQRRLSIGLAVGITAIWLAGTLAAGIIIRHELDEAFDSALQETAQRLLPLAVLDIVDRDTATPRAHRVAAIGEHEEYLTYLVRDAAGNILLQSHDADPGVFPGEPAHGFRETTTHRLYGEAAVSSTVFIEIAEPLAHRRMAAFEATIGLFAPLPILIPLSLLAVWWFVRRSVKPILAFRTEIEIRGEGNLSPLSGAGLPAEIAPVAEAVSRLMERLRRALEAERGFAANSAHELRTPIAAALAQTQRLIAQAPAGLFKTARGRLRHRSAGSPICRRSCCSSPERKEAVSSRRHRRICCLFCRILPMSFGNVLRSATVWYWTGTSNRP